MIVTHADSDHSGGALSVLEALPVGRLILILERGTSHPACSHKEQCRAGASAGFGMGYGLTCCIRSEQSYKNPKQRTNELSCVLRISTDHGSVLLPSDIEKRSEYQLAAQVGDVLFLDGAGGAPSW